jgi:hypothetical protein
MRLPTNHESVDDFIARLTEAVGDDRTHLYFDTSILMWVACLSPSVQAEFLHWAKSLDVRAHVPLWTLQEFYRHQTERTLECNLQNAAEAFSRSAREFLKQAGTIADQLTIDGVPMTAATLRDLAGRAAAVARSTKQWHPLERSADLLKWMSERCPGLDVALRSLETLSDHGAARYSHDVPPGFLDRVKQDKPERGGNRFGDLLFWQEVTVHAARVEAATVVVLTKDRKRDWFHPSPETPAGSSWQRLRPNNWSAVPHPHPMLSFELNARARGAKLLLCDELYLGAVVWQRDRAKYRQLASVAMDIEVARLVEPEEGRPPIAQRAAKRRATMTLGMKRTDDLLQAALVASDADAQPLIQRLDDDAPKVDEFVSGFSAATLSPHQPITIAAFAKRVHDRSLSGSGPEAALASRLSDVLDVLDEDAAVAVYGGLLASAYFREGVPRDRPASPILEEMFEWQADPIYQRLLTLLRRRLNQAYSPVLYVPGDKKERLVLNVQHDATQRQDPAQLSQVTFGDRQLLKEGIVSENLNLRSQLGGSSTVTVGTLVNLVCHHYGLPRRWVRVDGVDLEEPRFVPPLIGFRQIDRFEVEARTKRASPLSEEEAEADAGPEETPSGEEHPEPLAPDDFSSDDEDEDGDDEGSDE